MLKTRTAKKAAPKKVARKSSKPLKPTGPPPARLTSFIPRSVTPADRTRLDDMKKTLKEKTDSGVLVKMLGNYDRQAKELEDLRTKYWKLMEQVASLVKASGRLEAGSKEVDEVRKKWKSIPDDVRDHHNQNGGFAMDFDNDDDEDDDDD